MSVFVVALGSIGDALPLILVLKELVALEDRAPVQHCVVGVSRGVGAMVTELVGELPSQLCVEEISTAGILFEESASSDRGMVPECEAILERARSKDVLLFNLHSSFALVIAESLDIPCGVLSPCLPPPPSAGARRAWSALLDRHPALRSRIIASSAWSLMDVECWMLPLVLGRRYQRLRDLWDLPPLPLQNDTRLFRQGIPGWIGVSERLARAAHPPILPHSWHLSGPWLLERSRTTRISAPVVLVSFGSMTEAGLAPPLDTQRRLARALGAALGCEPLLHILTVPPFSPSEDEDPTPPAAKRHAASRMREKHGPVDYDSLLPNVVLWVHHGGGGTVHDAIRRQIPQLIIPCGFDQAAWAARVDAAGLGKRGPAWEETTDVDGWVDRACALAPEARRACHTWDDVDWSGCAKQTAESVHSWLVDVMNEW